MPGQKSYVILHAFWEPSEMLRWGELTDLRLSCRVLTLPTQGPMRGGGAEAGRRSGVRPPEGQTADSGSGKEKRWCSRCTCTYNWGNLLNYRMGKQRKGKSEDNVTVSNLSQGKGWPIIHRRLSTGLKGEEKPLALLWWPHWSPGVGGLHFQLSGVIIESKWKWARSKEQGSARGFSCNVCSKGWKDIGSWKKKCILKYIYFCYKSKTKKISKVQKSIFFKKDKVSYSYHQRQPSLILDTIFFYFFLITSAWLHVCMILYIVISLFWFNFCVEET